MIVDITSNAIDEMDMEIKKTRVANLAIYQAAQRSATMMVELAYAKTVYTIMERRLDAIEQTFVNIVKGRYA